MPIAYLAEQFEPSPDDLAEALPDLAPEAPVGTVAGLLTTIAELKAANERQAAQLNELAGPVEWLALGACDRGGHSYETLRKWCETGVVESRRERGRLFVNTRSLATHLARLGLAKAIRSA